MKALFAAASLSLCALPAAAAVTFDFRNGANERMPALEATVDGLGVAVTAGLYDGSTLQPDCAPGNGCADDRIVNKRNPGLGADDPNGGGNTDQGVIDGRDLNDLLTFTFGRMVTFGSVLFTQASGNDEVDIFVDGILVALNTEASGGPVDLSAFTGTSISFGADEDNDNFRVGAITVTPIPLPAAALALLTALGAAAATYRRRPA